MMRMKQCPTLWTKSVLVPIPKPGKTEEELGRDVANWRGISLIPSLAKLMMQMIADKLEVYLSRGLNKAQAGFLSGRSTLEHVATLKDTMVRNEASGTPMYTCFLDFSKAYDSINRDALWSSLRYYQVPEDLIDLLKSYYNETSSFVKLGNYWLPDPIATLSGVRQGCPLSPLLFNAVLNDLINKVSQMCDAARAEYMTVESAGVLAYADDIVVWAPNETLLNGLIETVAHQGAKIGLQLNIAKCAIIARGGGSNPEFIKQPIPYTKEYKYLGIRVTNKTRAVFLATDMNYRLGPLFRAAMGNVKKSFGFCKGSLQLRCQLATALVVSRMTYGYELWVNSDTARHALLKNMANLSRELLGIRTTVPPYRVVLWEAGFMDMELMKHLRQIALSIHWSEELFDTPIHRIMKTSWLFDDNRMVWTTYGVGHVRDFYGVNAVMEDEEDAIFDNMRDGEHDALDHYKQAIFDGMKATYHKQLLESNPMSTEFRYVETNGSRVWFVNHLRKMVDFAFGRRCLHELRCGCYPTMVYRKKTGWKAIMELRTCPFCSVQEDESVEHLLCTCSSWMREREHYLRDYLMYDNKLMMKMVLGHRLSMEEQALADEVGYEEPKVVLDICCFLQKVDARRSEYLRNQGWDITSRRSTRGATSGRGRGRRYEPVIRHSEEGEL